MDENDLVKKVLSGDKKTISKIITLVDNRDPKVSYIIDRLYPYTGRCQIIGITGPPGVGKSTLINQMVKEWNIDKKVAVIAIDPTSPFHGGAILGDRIRMQDCFLDENTFIRSIGTRGSYGGLSKSTHEITKVFDAAGYDIVLIETVGAGQVEVDIARLAHTTIVVVVPGLGDVIQTIKAGMFEIPDIVVVNKADLAGADQLVMDLKTVFNLSSKEWKPLVIKTVALKNEGVVDLISAIEKHWVYQKERGSLYEKERDKIKEELLNLIIDDVKRKILENINKDEILDLYIKKLVSKEITPYVAKDEIIKKILKDINI
ncbi:methylmalonyl Co-A mutase-associated GTPase MeaB [Candidatus Methanoliparum sp. LAM-1]|nr:methylmalonyl Co-A mutase-associated GTPase MeaB [Candidatus Methanoliparum sp. LAM-1]